MDITLTPKEMKALETACMCEYAMPGALLMEHAAQGVCAALKRHAPAQGAVLFLCGPGNNGGDGYAAARLWQAGGGRALVTEMTAVLRGDALLNRRLALEAGVRVFPLTEVETLLPACDAACDALFGTGLARAVEGEAAQAIKALNESGKPVVAVDIPSGLDGNTGMPLGTAVRATETVTFHRLKQGLVLGKSAAYTGCLTVHPILIPKAYGQAEGLRCMEPGDIPALLPPRCPNAHKGSYGKAVLFVGSQGMAGAAALCAKAAIKVGAGLTCVLCRASLVPIVQVLVPGAVCVALPEREGHLLPEAAALVEKQLASASGAAVGCGLGQTEDVLPVLDAFRRAACPVVWDADALNLLAAHVDMLPLKAADGITPHPGEAARLLGCTVPQVTGDTLEAARRLREKCGCHVLLKGARTVMTDGAYTAVNRFGSPAMAKGGSGDVLTGMLCGLVAQHASRLDMLTLMQLAALLHGLAGMRAEAQYGEGSVLPEQLADAIRVGKGQA